MSIAKIILTCFIAFLLQALIFRQVDDLIGQFFILIFPLAIVFFPPRTNTFLQYSLAFILGLSIDLIYQSGAIYASTALAATFFRITLLETSFVKPYEGYENTDTAFRFGYAWFGKQAVPTIFFATLWFACIKIFLFTEAFSILFTSVVSAFLSSILILIISYTIIPISKVFSNR